MVLSVEAVLPQHSMEMEQMTWTWNEDKAAWSVAELGKDGEGAQGHLELDSSVTFAPPTSKQVSPWPQHR